MVPPVPCYCAVYKRGTKPIPVVNVLGAVAFCFNENFYLKPSTTRQGFGLTLTSPGEDEGEGEGEGDVFRPLL